MSTTPNADCVPSLTVPKRRDVKSLTAALAGLTIGDRVAATFRDERYGVYRIEGALAKSLAYDDPVLAAVPLSSRGKPHPGLVLIERTPGPDTVVSQLEPAEPTDRLPVDPSTVVHGDLVEVVFACPPWGGFRVTGYAVALGERAVMIGSWFVNTDVGLSTYPGVRVVEAHLVRPDATETSCPPRATIQGDG